MPAVKGEQKRGNLQAPPFPSTGYFPPIHLNTFQILAQISTEFIGSQKILPEVFKVK